jgi:hypothetical protein
VQLRRRLAEPAEQPHERIVLDMDSTEIPVYGRQEQSADNGHIASTCYHPLLLLNRDGDCLAAKLRPGNVHSAEGWEEVLLPESEEASGEDDTAQVPSVPIERGTPLAEGDGL